MERYIGVSGPKRSNKSPHESRTGGELPEGLLSGEIGSEVIPVDVFRKLDLFREMCAERLEELKKENPGVSVVLEKDRFEIMEKLGLKGIISNPNKKNEQG